MMLLSKQRVLLAELCGWTNLHWDLHDSTKLLGTKCFGVMGWEELEVEDYHNDLNAVHQIEAQLINQYPDTQRWCQYAYILTELALRDNPYSPVHRLAFHASAHHRCEALLQLFNKL